MDSFSGTFVTYSLVNAYLAMETGSMRLVILVGAFSLWSAQAHAQIADPPTADAGGPYFVTSTQFNVTLLGTGLADSGLSIVLFEWDYEGDGTFDFSSPTTGTTSHTYFDLTNLPLGAFVEPEFRVTDELNQVASELLE